MLVMDFSGIYAREDWMCSHRREWISFRHLEGTDGYCTRESAQEIRREMRERRLDDLHFLDSGNYHYLTKFWLERIQEPFELVVFDRHSDMQPSALLPLTSCGNWLLEALQELPLLQRVWLIGPDRDQLRQIPEEYRKRILAVEEKEAGKGPKEGAKEGQGRKAELPVYLSIDKDVLCKEEVPVNWDQGDMSLDILMQWLDYICDGRKILGADICGEPADSGSDHGLDRACRQNDLANRGMAEYLLRRLARYGPMKENPEADREDKMP